GLDDGVADLGGEALEIVAREGAQVGGRVDALEQAHRIQCHSSEAESPIRAPTATSRGVWPSSSISLCVSCSGSFHCWSIMRLSTAAWRPAARRKPAASYMTTRLKYSVTPNRTDVTPWRNATSVESAQTDAACELGMPPVSTKRRRFQRLVRTNSPMPL